MTRRRAAKTVTAKVTRRFGVYHVADCYAVHLGSWTKFRGGVDGPALQNCVNVVLADVFNLTSSAENGLNSFMLKIAIRCFVAHTPSTLKLCSSSTNRIV